LEHVLIVKVQIFLYLLGLWLLEIFMKVLWSLLIVT